MRDTERPVGRAGGPAGNPYPVADDNQADRAGGTDTSHCLGGAPDEAGTDASRAVLTVMRLFRALERVDAGLTPQQYRILKLAGAGGERSARLAERLAVAKPTLTTTADGLVAAGYMRRGAEAGDRRVVRLCLTPAGHEALSRADAAYAAWLDRLLGAMDEADQALVGQALGVLDTTMDELRRTRQVAQGAAKAQSAAKQRAGNSRAKEDNCRTGTAGSRGTE
jgi:DNA-binding MarR family transcriptional regulator